jgi:hypothetical protein
MICAVPQDWRRSVSMRLVALALDGRGRLSDKLVVATAVRGALLIDLALRERITDAGEAIEVDRRPTGFEPADRLLAVPVKSLGDLVRSGPVDQRDLAEAHVRCGTWSLTGHWPRRRYLDREAAQTERDRIALSTNLSRRWARDDAALAVVARRAGLLSTSEHEPGEHLLRAGEPVRWLVELTMDEIGWMNAAGAALAAADPPMLPPATGI